MVGTLTHSLPARVPLFALTVFGLPTGSRQSPPPSLGRILLKKLWGLNGNLLVLPKEHASGWSAAADQATAWQWLAIR